ncbi:PREDICTED: sorbitol dehydrogenase-like [Branchiostoma belcheri]|uniref:Sorbitol dehydrogenase n=1 Tax=Branchiostoma belcheri TaxID=7741 RepID=A0A6P4YNQ1_BRABE|nr:PREDICTED: sorbitol dehydrogenase-like [Branchiostoma belcheri]
MHSVGICGTDVHVLTEGSLGQSVLTGPTVSGHEASGTVRQVGEGVTHLAVGDRVAIEPCISCRYCTNCKAGRYYLCPRLKACSIPPVHGLMCRYKVHPADLCYKLPDNVSLEEGALLEPLSVAVHACNRGRDYVDINAKRLEVAQQMGAHVTVHVTSRDSQAMADQVVRALGGHADVTIECSGAEAAVQTGIYATKSGGVMVQVGLGADMITIPLVDAALREVDIRGTFAYPNCYPTALSMVASGQVNVKPLVTHRYSLEQALEAFEVVKRGEGIKVMVKCDKTNV